MKFSISNSAENFGKCCSSDYKLPSQQRRLHKNLLGQHIQAKEFTLEYCDVNDDNDNEDYDDREKIDYIYEDDEDNEDIQEETNYKNHKLNSLTMPLTGKKIKMLNSNLLDRRSKKFFVFCFVYINRFKKQSPSLCRTCPAMNFL
jgi:hypothetical protein